ncbi:uncharacterized protein ATC70_011713 [Mucor velutinosus]|uniref:Uncharacterized protein n=1 Tax=Mucor velutinosus TaxID=708070 RepID=A0AAN7DL88_9FUNG|nr:hypothetical protein ATC70_011713 [Mucor velutinosus]
MIPRTLQRLSCLASRCRPVLNPRHTVSTRSLCQFTTPKRLLTSNAVSSMQWPQKAKVLSRLTCSRASLRHKFMSSMAASAHNTVSSSTKAVVTHTKPIVAYWLYFNAGMVFAIVVVGGLTRLTESGLSIVEWNVISGMKPPRSEQEWKDEFEKYKQYPEYKL